MVPPSNRWYSGLVFGDQPQPVFAEPLSFGLTDSGFTLGLPTPTVDAKVIIAPHVPAVTVDAGAASAQVSAADPVSVTVDLLDASGAVLGHVVLAAGSPFVSFTAEQDVTLELDRHRRRVRAGRRRRGDRRRGHLAVGARRRDDRRRLDDAERGSDGHAGTRCPRTRRTRRRRPCARRRPTRSPGST